MAKVPVALQLYTVRDETAKDFAGTMRKVAQMGYAGVEFAGTGGLSVEAMRELLEETGLKGMENINYLQAIKRVIGMIDKPFVNETF